MTEDTPERPRRRAIPRAQPTTSVRPPKRLDSYELFEGEREVLIEYEGGVYRLRITRKGKLILHK